MDRPEWWDWELELSAHVEIRMEDREFSEIELRLMIDQASSVEVEADHVADRWLLRTRHGGRPWAVIVEPDPETKTLVVITAYELER